MDKTDEYQEAAKFSRDFSMFIIPTLVVAQEINEEI
tara:strand:- start:310 stop:417 length:108 start_codon:yes stop_codon:yes gene_type:complete